MDVAQTVTEMVPVQEQRAVNCGCCSSPAPVAAPGEAPATPPPAAEPDATSSTSSTGAAAVGGACNTCCNPCPCPVCVTCWKPVSHQVSVQYPVSRFTPNSRVDTVAYYEY
jgi:hypothetical protein